MTQPHPIFQKELDAFDKLTIIEGGFDVEFHCEDCKRATKSFLLAALQRASLAVVEESVDDKMKLPPNFEKAQKIFNPHGRYDICALCGFSPEGYRDATLATAKSIIGIKEE